jgi:tetratricopeptide (TPR) repeat protein
LKSLKAFLLVWILMAVAFVPAGAVPYETYTYDFWNNPVPSPHAYVPIRVVDGQELGIGGFKTPQDIFAIDDHIYVVDSGNSRIVHLTREWQVVRIIDSFDNTGIQDKFRNPRGIHVDAAGNMYVADRDNGRIVVLDRDAALRQIITSPAETHADLFTSDFRFRPDKLGVDQYGTIYVVSAGVYDGIMEFDIFGEFQGFVGAPRVHPTLADYIWRLIGTKEQKERMKLFLPVEHSNVHVDYRGFIYATATGGEISAEDKIRRINTSGVDRLMRISWSPPIGDFPDVTSSIFVDVVSREHDIYSILDRANGRIFTYSSTGHLLYAFGALGEVQGAFTNPAGLTELDQHLLVLDSIKNSITVFAPTEYMQLIHNAIAKYSMGNYDAATENWYRVLELNSNFDLAYTGIGNAHFMKGEYAEAMRNYRLANDRQNYSEAYRYYRKQVTEKYFGFFMAAVVILIIYVLFFATSKKSEQSVVEAKAQQAATYDLVQTWEEMKRRPLRIQLKRIWYGLSFALKLMVSPLQGFWDLKYEKRGNLPTAIILIILLVVSYLIMYQYSGFIFNTRDPRYLNLVSESISILVPIMMWAAINWSLTTLMNGKGTFKDILIATGYSFTPLILVLIPMTIVSNYLAADEGAFYYLVLSIALVWSLFLLFFSTMVTHEYSLGATIGVTLLILVGIGITMFIALLFVDIVLQLFAFIGEVYRELAFRL